MTAVRWQACLDRFDQHLQQQFAALAAGSADRIVAFVPDQADLGTLPAHLRERAHELASEARRLEAAVAAALAGAARQMQLVTVINRQTGDARSAAYVDSRG